MVIKCWMGADARCKQRNILKVNCICVDVSWVFPLSSHVCPLSCFHRVFAVWGAVRSDHLFHWLFSCFSHYHPLSISPPLFSVPLSCVPDSPFLSQRNSLRFCSATASPMCTVAPSPFCIHLFTILLCFFLPLTQTHLDVWYPSLCLLLLCRKQCTGMGVQSVEGG